MFNKILAAHNVKRRWCQYNRLCLLYCPTKCYTHTINTKDNTCYGYIVSNNRFTLCVNSMGNITPVGQLCVFRFKLTKTLFNLYLNNNYDNYIYVLQKLVAHNVKRRWCQYNRLCLLYCPTKCITPVSQLCIFRFKLTKIFKI